MKGILMNPIFSNKWKDLFDRIDKEILDEVIPLGNVREIVLKPDYIAVIFHEDLKDLSRLTDRDIYVKDEKTIIE